MDTDAAEDLLATLDAAESLKDISPLKSVGLHKLSGDRAGQTMGDDDKQVMAYLFSF